MLFAREWDDDYDADEVVSWAWLGPLTASDRATTHVPDLEISLRGFRQNDPPAGASHSANGISEQNPLDFEWAPYPGASMYWVDLARGDQLTIVWQSGLVDTTDVDFDGALDDGSHVAAGTYRWGIGARKDLEGYQLTVYGYLLAVEITP